MSEGDDQSIGHPHQRVSYDLSKDPRELRRDGKKAPVLVHGDRSDRRDPEEMMRQMGFEPSKYMTPLQFLLAVQNDDLELLFKNENRRKRIEAKGGLAINYRIEAAKTAAKFMHQEQPKIAISKDEGSGFGDALTQAITEGNDRVRSRRVIFEEIERISPKVPLAPASYPPIFQEAIEQPEEEGEDDEYAE